MRQPKPEHAFSKNSPVFSAQNPIRVFLVDDHPVILDGVRSFILRLQANGEPFALAGCAQNVDDAVSRMTEAQTHLPDLLLLDVWLSDIPMQTGIDVLHALHQRNIYIPTLTYSGECVDIFMLGKLLQMGISGYVLKNVMMDLLAKAMYAVALGNTYFVPEICKRMQEGATNLLSPLFPKMMLLSQQELRYLKYFLRGFTVKEMVQEFNCMPCTLYTYGERIKKKLDIQKLEQLDRKSITGVIGILLHEENKAT